MSLDKPAMPTRPIMAHELQQIELYDKNLNVVKEIITTFHGQTFTAIMCNDILYTLQDGKFVETLLHRYFG
jgi:hypothetical protein